MVSHTSNSRKSTPTYSDWRQIDGWLSGAEGAGRWGFRGAQRNEWRIRSMSRRWWWLHRGDLGQTNQTVFFKHVSLLYLNYTSIKLFKRRRRRECGSLQPLGETSHCSPGWAQAWVWAVSTELCLRCHPGILHLFGCISPSCFKFLKGRAVSSVFSLSPWGRGRWQGRSSLHGQQKKSWSFTETSGDDVRILESPPNRAEHSDGCHSCLVCEMCSNALGEYS